MNVLLIILIYIGLLSLFYFGGYLWRKGSLDCSREEIKKTIRAMSNIKEVG